MLPAMSTALSLWRRLSAFLLQPLRSERVPLVPDETWTSPQVANVAATLNDFLGVFVAEPDGQARQLDHLRLVIAEVRKFLYVIFSHPCEWRFDFGRPGRADPSRRILVLRPGLVKLTHPDGKRYGRPRQVLSPVVTEV
jgi:hypothetical protein